LYLHYLALESLNQCFHSVYKEIRRTYCTEWPPNQLQLISIVNNTLIHCKEKGTEKALLDISKCQRGASSINEMTSSHPSRVTKSITSIFDSPDQKFILIEGAPGIGKTILVKEIAYHWANKNVLQRKKVFLLFVRDPSLHSVSSVEELILYLNLECDYLNDKEIKDATDELRKSMGLNIVFLIDGFDECPTDSQLKVFIEKLVKCKFLPKCMVIITSRPHASMSLRSLANQRIEILGLDKIERDKYISKSLAECEAVKKTELEAYLKLQPAINSITHVPLHLACLLYLFKEGNMPETLTELNEQFIIHTIYRHLNKKNNKSQIDKKFVHLKDFPDHILSTIGKLSDLAMSGLWQKKLIFTYDEVKKIYPEIDNDIAGDINGFGLLQVVQHYAERGAGTTFSFNFLHLTMQEFLAAYHVSTLPRETELCMAFNHFLSNYVWIMYVGIVGIKSESFVQYQKNHCKDSSSHKNELFAFQCYT